LPIRSKTIDTTSPEEEAFRKASVLRAEKIALRLIARAEQCTGGLRRKLERRKCDSGSIDTVIEQLCELGLLDDNRFSRLWLESRLRLPRSPLRLLAGLCSRGIDRDDAEAAIREVLNEENEYSLLLRFVRKKRRKTDERELKFLLKSEGFSNGVIKRYFEE